MNWFVEHPEVTRYILEHERKNEMQATLPTVVVEPIDIPMEDDLVHTVDHPFCDDHRCPCHYGELFEERIEQPVLAGLMTGWEANNLHWFENI